MSEPLYALKAGCPTTLTSDEPILGGELARCNRLGFSSWPQRFGQRVAMAPATKGGPMAQVTTGLRSVLSNPAVYNATQRAFGADAARRDIASRYLRVTSEDRILDIGCGTAEILPYLPASVEYWGFDLSEAYIEAAQKRFGNRGFFRCADVGAYIDQDRLPDMDLVLATGVLHHLGDSECLSLISIASSVLRPGGRLVTVDPTYASGQSRASRWLVSRDRGQSVRTPEDYRALATTEFERVQAHLRHNMIRIPYSHCVMVCTK